MQTNKATKLDKIIIGICIGLLSFFAISIAARFLTRQILIEKLHWDNWVTRTIWFDNSAAGAFGSSDGGDENTEITVDIDWESLYPFERQDESHKDKNNSKLSMFTNKTSKMVSSIKSVEDKIGTYAESLLVCYNEEVSLAKKYDSLIGTIKLPQMGSGDDILFLNNGYLTYYEPAVAEADIEVIADSLADFSDYLKDNGIDFCYVNAGSKVCPYDRQNDSPQNENTNENGDALIKALEVRNVDCLDMREKMIEDGLDWYDSYYITDHHWKTETGLWAAEKLAGYLNDKFGYNFDLEKYSPSEYNMTTTENFWIGGQGRKVTLANADLESYTKIIPKFETSFHVEVPSRSISKDGTYEDALYNNSIYRDIFNYSESDHLNKADAYGSVTWKNDPLGLIRNNAENPNSKKKILFIQDSFGWYSSTFIACGIDKVDIIHPGVFTGSIKKYIEEAKPDTVVMMMCEKNIKPISKYDHTDVFDLN